MNISVKKQNEEFEQFIDSVTFEAKETDLTPELAEERTKRADADEFIFCKIYFPQIFSQPFNDMHQSIKNIGPGKHTRSGARKIGKSAYAYIAKIIRPIVQGKGGMYGVLMRTLIDGSVERTASLVRLIKKNPKLFYDYKINIQQDKKGYYIINNTTLMALSIDKGLRGFMDDDFKRFNFILCDDFYSRNTAASANDNEKTTNFITSEVDGQLEDGGIRLALGNSINDDCPIVRLKAMHPENHFSLPALIDGKTCWPKSLIHTTEYWDDKKNDMPFDVWMGEYMDDPLVKGEIFDIGWISTFNIQKIKIAASLTAIDPSTGKSPSACFKGVATLGITTSGEIDMLDIYIRKEDYELVFDYIFSIRSKYPHWKTLLFENNFNQFGYAKPYYDAWRKRSGSTIPIIPFDAKHLATEYYGSDKDGRIMNLVYPHQSGGFKYADTIFDLSGSNVQALTNDAKLYLSQYLGFGKNKNKLDGLDAAATAFIMLPRYLSTGSFKPLKKRMYRNNEDGWLNKNNFSYRR